MSRRERLECSLLFLSLGLLLLACADEGVLGNAAKLTWMGSLFVLNVMNSGAAFGSYVASVALFSGKHFEGGGSIFDRPDNAGFFILLLCCVFMALRHKDKRWRLDKVSLWVGAFMLYGLGQLCLFGLLNRYEIGWFFRMFGLPFGMFLVLKYRSWAARELHSFVSALTVLGCYMATVSLLERFGVRDFIFPSWLNDPYQSPSLTTGRSGGLLMQSEWNAITLSLIFCLIILVGIVGNSRLTTVRYGAAGLCGLAIFFTYTRAAWLALTIALCIAMVGGSSDSGQYRRLTKIFAPALIATLAMFVFLLPDATTKARMEDSETVTFRFNTWAIGLRLYRAHPVMGIGFGQFTNHMNDFAETEKMVEDPDKHPSVLHNTPLTVAAELGTIGLFLYVLTTVMILRSAKQSMFRAWDRQSLVWVAMFATIYLLNTQFVSAQEPTTNLIFFGTLGGLAGLTLQRGRDGETFSGSSVAARSMRRECPITAGTGQ